MQRFAVYHFVTFMQDLDKLHEIEELGLEDREDAPPEEPEGGNSSMVPLLLLLPVGDSPVGRPCLPGLNIANLCCTDSFSIHFQC